MYRASCQGEQQNNGKTRAWTVAGGRKIYPERRVALCAERLPVGGSMRATKCVSCARGFRSSCTLLRRNVRMMVVVGRKERSWSRMRINHLKSKPSRATQPGLCVIDFTAGWGGLSLHYGALLVEDPRNGKKAKIAVQNGAPANHTSASAAFILIHLPHHSTSPLFRPASKI